MSASIHVLPCPEFMAPSLSQPVGGPITKQPGDARSDLDKLLDDIRAAWRFAIANNLAVLTVAGDRNGAYMVLAPSPRLYAIFGDECAMWRRKVEAGLTVEHWLGSIEHIRVFWREVKCTH